MAPCTPPSPIRRTASPPTPTMRRTRWRPRSEEHTSELQSRQYLVCRLLLEKKKHDHDSAHAVSLEMQRHPRDALEVAQLRGGRLAVHEDVELLTDESDRRPLLLAGRTGR